MVFPDDVFAAAEAIERTPERIEQWAKSIAPATAQLARAVPSTVNLLQ